MMISCPFSSTGFVVGNGCHDHSRRALFWTLPHVLHSREGLCQLCEKSASQEIPILLLHLLLFLQVFAISPHRGIAAHVDRLLPLQRDCRRIGCCRDSTAGCGQNPDAAESRSASELCVGRRLSLAERRSGRILRRIRAKDVETNSDGRRHVDALRTVDGLDGNHVTEGAEEEEEAKEEEEEIKWVCRDKKMIASGGHSWRY